MPVELRKAHEQLDSYVLGIYKLSTNASEPEVLARLFELYAELSQSAKA